MYGVVNKAIEELVIVNFGEEKWELIKLKSGVDVDFFLSSESYDDSITYKLAQAISDEMKISVGDVLKIFGEWWILETGKKKYGYLLESGGDSLRKFLINLPVFHNRIMMIYPNITPPEFKVTDINETSLHVHYFSKREGLKDFVHGLLTGLGKLFSTPVELELLEDRESGYTHEIFKVKWS